jgi:UDP-N-acetylmuramoyl-tripeptide--D-alanyl-D-alanine ligase
LNDTIQVEKSKEIKIYSFGVKTPAADLVIDSVTANPFVEITFSSTKITSHLIGLYNSNNINAALAIGKYFGVSDFEIKTAIESYIPENNRSQLITINSNQVILDAYNANPSSMAVAIDNFIQLDKLNKIAVLGDMFELGEFSLDEHKNIVTLLIQNPSVIVFLIGKDFYANKVENNHIHFFENFDAFVEFFKAEIRQNNIILIKGSRGMALERTLNFI